MIIEELQDRKALLHEFDLLRDEPLLEYVWEVALEFNEAPSTLVGHTKTSFAPTIFANRYAESKLIFASLANKNDAILTIAKA